MFTKTILASAILTIAGTGLIQENAQASVADTLESPTITELQPIYVVAQTRSKNRRENRQDDRGRHDDREERRDCRQDEGVVGNDKRDCKQDSRQGKKDKDKDKDGGGRQ